VRAILRALLLLVISCQAWAVGLADLTDKDASGGLREAPAPAHDAQGPVLSGQLTRARLPRTDDYTQAGQFYLLCEQWEKDEMVANYIDALSQCDRAQDVDARNDRAKVVGGPPDEGKDAAWRE